MSSNISIKKAALLIAVSKYASVVFNILFTMILARLLTPEDYGIVAVTVVFTNFFTILADMGLSNGIIQDKGLTKQDNDGIFLFSVFLGLLLGLVFFCCSFGIASFYDNKAYIPIGTLLGISLFFSTANVVPNALILKHKDFKLIAQRNVAIPLISSLITVGLAWIGLSYYSLVFQSLLNSLFTFLLNYVTAYKRYTLRLVFRNDFNGIHRIFNYSLYQFLFNVINYFSRNLDNLLVGKFFGAIALGYYDKAYKLMVYPTGMLTHVITPALQPILSDYQNDKDFIYEKYIRILKFLSLIGVFIVAYSYIAASEIILILFGSQWIQAIPYFAWLSLSVWAQMILGTTGSIYSSAGDTKRLFITGCISTLITITAIICGVLSGNLKDLARNVSLAYMFQFWVVMFILIKFTLKQPFLKFLKNFLPDLTIGIVLFCIGNLFYIISISNVFLLALIKLIIIGVVFLAMCKLLGQLHYIIFIHH